MNSKNFVLQAFFLIACSVWLGVVLTVRPSVLWGGLALLVYLAFVGWFAKSVLTRVFHFIPGWRTWILGAGLAFFTWAQFLGVLLFVSPLSHASAAIIALCNGLVWWLAAHFVPAKNDQPAPVAVHHEPDLIRFPFISTGAVIVFFGLVLYGLYLLAISRTGAAILSPWQTIVSRYIIVFCAATVIAGCLIFSRLKTSVILLVLIGNSFLLHSYLPMTHQLVYGADQWRHIANEERIVAGLPWQAAVVTDAVDASSFLGRLSYGNLWSISALLAQLTGGSLVAINAWLVPILWSVLVPLLLYELGRTFRWERVSSLFFAWLGFLPFAWQANGALTLPVSFGFIGFLFGVILLLRRLSGRGSGQLMVVVGLALVSFFGYALFAILYWLLWGVVELARYWHKHHGKITPAAVAVIVFVSLSFMSALEIGLKYSRFDFTIHWWEQIKQLLGNFMSWYLAAGPRSHVISTGNVIFNEVPNYAFVSNWFTGWHAWVVVFMFLFWAAVLYGAWQVARRGVVAEKVFAWWGGGIFGGYVLSRYFLTGENILTRRLDVVLALVFLFFVCLGLHHIFEKWKLYTRPWLLFVFVVILSVAISASYSFGPNLQAMSVPEYRAMQYVWQGEEAHLRNCVLADAYPLLALEAISHKEIIGGGFPITTTFGQPDRVRLYQEAISKPSRSVFDEAVALTGSGGCFVVVPNDAEVGLTQIGLHTLARFDYLSILWYTK